MKTFKITLLLFVLFFTSCSIKQTESLLDYINNDFSIINKEEHLRNHVITLANKKDTIKVFVNEPEFRYFNVGDSINEHITQLLIINKLIDEDNCLH